MKPHRILSLSVIGGFLDGLHLPFDPALNCIIGARGTGKTTILELIRYALDQLPRRDLKPAALRRVEALIEGNLQGGRVELHIETSEGMRYIVSRAAGEEPMVLDAKRSPTGISLKSGGFFHADIFSQNEIETIADTKRFQLDLLDSFEPEKMAGYDWHLEDLRQDVLQCGRDAMPLKAKRAALLTKIQDLPQVEQNLKALIGKAGDETAEAVNAAHEKKALRDRESRAVEATRGILQAVHRDLGGFVGRLKGDFSGTFNKAMLEGPNKDIIAKAVEQLKACVREVDQHVQAALGKVAKTQAGIDETAHELREAHDHQDVAFRELIEKHKTHQAQSAERVALEKRRNEIKAAEAEAARLLEGIKQLDDQRMELLGKFSALRDERFALRKEIAERINQALLPMIRVTLSQDGNTSEYQTLIEEALKEHGVQRGVVAQKLASSVPPSTLAEYVREGKVPDLMRDGDLNVNQAARVVQAFSDEQKLAELEMVELYDAPTIELKDGMSYKDSTTLSTGQKCTAILPILLLESASPLLIDQPEDNLDNRFVFQTVVDGLGRVKLKRQLVFATHNPNIPVLGEAERVIVMDSDGEHGRVGKDGSVDDCKSQIITLLEGGAEAFRQRSNRYQLAA